jgi:glycerophosphoryl diester phosphodiesterase
MYNAEEGIIIERDNSQGDLNGFKKLFKVKLGKVGDFVEKTELVNLMDIKDPSGISGKSSNGDIGLGSVFAMPFVTIEDVVVIDENTLGVLNDNNYPFSIGRHVGSKQPDDNEFMLIKLPTPLKLAK